MKSLEHVTRSRRLHPPEHNSLHDAAVSVHKLSPEMQAVSLIAGSCWSTLTHHEVISEPFGFTSNYCCPAAREPP
jgi:hypothetical protein